MNKYVILILKHHRVSDLDKTAPLHVISAERMIDYVFEMLSHFL